MTKLLEKRFSELEIQLIEAEATKHRKTDAYGSDYLTIDSNLLLNWQVKAKSLISNACGAESQHFAAFIESEKPSMYSSNYDNLLRSKAVFLAAKEDYEGGYLNSLRNLVQAEVFCNELEQAEELLNAGYATAAAVIAGVVLETNIRNLCTTQRIGHASLDRMNADLAKAGVYNSIQQKRITALAGIRNSAAHGKPDEFTKADVKGMIEDIERFISSILN